MPAGEVIGSYHALWQVEASFRMSKTDLRARPVFHHTRDAIEAHRWSLRVTCPVLCGTPVSTTANKQ